MQIGQIHSANINPTAGPTEKSGLGAIRPSAKADIAGRTWQLGVLSEHMAAESRAPRQPLAALMSQVEAG